MEVGSTALRRLRPAATPVSDPLGSLITSIAANRGAIQDGVYRGGGGSWGSGLQDGGFRGWRGRGNGIILTDGGAEDFNDEEFDDNELGEEAGGRIGKPFWYWGSYLGPSA